MRFVQRLFQVLVLIGPLAAWSCHAMLVSSDSAANNADNAQQAISRRLAMDMTPENARKSIQREMFPKLNALAILKGIIAAPLSTPRHRAANDPELYENPTSYKLAVAAAALGFPAALVLFVYLLTRRAMAVREREQANATITQEPIVIQLPVKSSASKESGTRKMTLDDFLNSSSARAADKLPDNAQ